MMKQIAAAVIGIIIGFGGGYLLFDKDETASKTDNSAMEHSADTTMVKMNADGTHDHPMLEVDKSKPVPTLKVEATKDAMNGWNMHLITENYTFTGADVNKDPVANTGHAHIYVNGVKVARPYSEWQYLDADNFKDGENKVLVTLNANNHAEWIMDGKHIQAETTITK